MNCNYHPIKYTNGYVISENGWLETEVEGISITKNVKSSCNILHCDPVPITEKQALEAKAIYDEEGNKGLAIVFGGWTAEAYDKFQEEWKQ